MKANKTGVICASICVFLWAFIPVVARFGQTQLDYIQFLFWSSLISFLTLLIVTKAAGQLSQFKRYSARDLVNISLLGLPGTFLYYLLLYLGYKNADGMSVLVMQYTWPVFIALLSVFILKEVFHLRTLVALICGFVAVLLVLSKGEPAQLSMLPEASLLWVLAGAFCFALFSVLSKKVSYEPLSMNTLFFAVATVCAGTLMFTLSEPVSPRGNHWIPVLANGIFINGISYFFWIVALRRLPASEAAIFIFCTPVLSAVYLYLFFASEFLPVYFVSLLLVVTAGIIAQAGQRSQRRE